MGEFATARLILCWPLLHVYPRHVEWLNDQNLMRWSEQRYREHTTESQWDYLQDAAKEGNPVVIDILLKPDQPRPINDQFGASIGTIAAYVDLRHRRADMGIMIGAPYHGNGYGTEAWWGAMWMLQNEFQVRKFEAGCVADNAGMNRLLVRLRFQFEGTRKNHFLIDGERRDMNMYGHGQMEPKGGTET